jgi:beta-glucanase (GH16 family)
MNRHRALRVGAVIATAAAVVVAMAAPAQAAPQHPTRVSLSFASPTRGSKANDTLDLSFTGTGLKSVMVYRLTQPVARATVSADGTSATATLDTTRFRDGPLALTAVAEGSGPPFLRSTAFAGPLVLLVDNATADHHLAGYRARVLDDEFSGTDLDRSIWCTRFPYTGGPTPQVPDPGCMSADGTAGSLDTLGGDGTAQGQEDEVYRDFNANGDKLHVEQNGYLSLRATDTRPDQPYLKYESSMIRSKKEFAPTSDHSLYLTARVRLPSVQGTWPAFWLVPGFTATAAANWPPEVDVFEGALNVQDDKVNYLHINAINNGVPGGQTSDGQLQQTYSDPTLYDPQWQNYTAPASIRDQWIEVGLEWTVNSVCWYVQGTKISCQNYTWQQNDGSASNPATVILNLAVGGPWAGRYGVDDASFPTHFDVDHVRIYQK